MDNGHTASQLPVMIVLGIATLLGYYAGQGVRRLRLPALIGYMVLGVILGPSLFHLFDAESLHDVSFITELALGFVAFTIGSELNLKSLQRLGYGIISIIFAESLTAFFVVLAAVYTLTWIQGTPNLPLALIFAAVAPASAPAGTVAVIHEYRAKGPLTKALYAVVGFDDGLAILIFGFAAALARTLLISKVNPASESMLAAMKAPALEIVLSIGVGSVLGLLFCQIVRRINNSRDMLIVVFATVMIGTGLSQQYHLSLILTNMLIGFILANTRREHLVHKVTAPVMDTMPLLFVLFFCLAGAHLEIALLPSLGLLGIVYILARSGGLIGGARLGAMLGKVHESVKRYVGLGILSQAGVAIGLSLIVQADFTSLVRDSRYDFSALKDTMYYPPTIAATVITSITATCIFFEIVGPICTKIALTKAGEINAAPEAASSRRHTSSRAN